MSKLTLNTVLNIEDNSILKHLIDLKEQHKAGEFIVYCIKNYHKAQDFSRQMEQTKQQIQELNNKFDKLQEMTLKTYCLLEVGKRLGLEETPKNLILSEFILNKQLKELNNLLGVEIRENKDATKYADDVVEYIINSYDSVLKQVVSIANTPQILQAVEELPEQEVQASEQANEPEEQISKEEPKAFGEGIELDDLLDFCSV